MGMFDTIVPDEKNPIRCPGCKRELKNFQTKALDDLMNTYTEGQKERTWYGFKTATRRKKNNPFTMFEIDKKDKRVSPHPKYHRFYAYEWCDGCKKMVGQFFQFDEDGLLVRYGNPVVEEDIES